jgi:hypothetical protein
MITINDRLTFAFNCISEFACLLRTRLLHSPNTLGDYHRSPEERPFRVDPGRHLAHEPMAAVGRQAAGTGIPTVGERAGAVYTPIASVTLALQGWFADVLHRIAERPAPPRASSLALENPRH